MTVGWHRRPRLLIDAETTGIDPETDRIVQVAAALVHPAPGDPRGFAVEKSWCQVVNPGVPVPDAAVEIHGITTERTRAEGADPASAVGKVAALVEWAWAQRIPVVGMNVGGYDLNLVDRELHRHVGRRLDTSEAVVLDVLTLDRACDRYRRGRRRLEDLAVHYGVVQDGAHDALADCMTAAGVLERQVAWAWETDADGRFVRRGYAALRGDLVGVHALQVRAHAAWAAHHQEYLRTRAKDPDPSAVVDGSWPWRPAPAPAEAAR